jgi:hypothetical protein
VVVPLEQSVALAIVIAGGRVHSQRQPDKTRQSKWETTALPPFMAGESHGWGYSTWAAATGSYACGFGRMEDKKPKLGNKRGGSKMDPPSRAWKTGLDVGPRRSTLSDISGHHGHARAITANTSCGGPLQRLCVKWDLNKGDLRRKIKAFWRGNS